MTGAQGGRVGLSTMAVFPDGCARAFALASELGYDGVEIMVWSDPVSQDTEALRRLSAEYDVSVLSVHAPTTLLTQAVWGRDPWAKLVRSAEHAEALGAAVVVVHPPFRWQRAYGAGFSDGIAELGDRHHTVFAVENMFPWRAGGAEIEAYAPGWDPRQQPYEHITLDFSHAATSRLDSLELAVDLGSRLTHVHLADGSGSLKDEHLAPGRGNQPCDRVLSHLADIGWDGHIVAEVNTRRDPARRTATLAETLLFARTHLRTSRPGQ